MTKIITRTRQLVDLLQPDMSALHIVDIAWSLANICRYNGHTRTHYSVAQHCVHVSHLVSEPYRLHGLLHDASEAYLGDVSTPLKKIMPGYRELEDDWMNVILTRYGVTRNWDEVKKADYEMLCFELYHFFDYEHDPEIELTPIILTQMSQRQAFTAFLQRFEELTADNGTLDARCA